MLAKVPEAEVTLGEQRKKHDEGITKFFSKTINRQQCYRWQNCIN